MALGSEASVRGDMIADANSGSNRRRFALSPAYLYATPVHLMVLGIIVLRFN